MIYNNMSNDKYYIKIDCPPGNERPNNILYNILVDTKLNKNNFKVSSKIFGEWIFVLNEDCESNYFIDSIPTIKSSLTKCYNTGQIRYAEWYEE